MVSGAESFAVTKYGRFLIMDGGYNQHDSFYVSRIRGGRIEQHERLEFVNEDSIPVQAAQVVWNSAKALILTKGGDICFMDFLES